MTKAQTPAGIYAARDLERFDKTNQQKLLAESRAFEEAEQTSDLNLPYSVARMIIEQAFGARGGQRVRLRRDRYGARQDLPRIVCRRDRRCASRGR